MKIAKDIGELIGNTPLIQIKTKSSCTILGKCEFMNPTHSVKDRIAKNMINEALKQNKIDKNTTIIEPTSGNTGIGLASVCASLGIKLILTMPESMSKERRQLLVALGAKLVLTPAKLGMKGSIEKADELNNEIDNSFVLRQFDNDDNPNTHRKTTALEILKDTNSKIDIFVASVGTGGSITGISEVLKENNPNIKIIAIEPEESAVLSGQEAGSHKIQGIGAGFIPTILNSKIIDEIYKVKYQDALETARNLAKNDGLIVGISSGANVFVAQQIAKKYDDKIIVTMLNDTGERYLSSGIYDEKS